MVVVGGGGAAGFVTHGVALTAPLPTRLGLTMGLGRAEEADDADCVGATAAVPQAEAAAERPERAVEDLSFSTRLAFVDVEADWEEAPAMGG